MYNMSAAGLVKVDFRCAADRANDNKGHIRADLSSHELYTPEAFEYEWQVTGACLLPNVYSLQGRCSRESKITVNLYCNYWN